MNDPLQTLCDLLEGGKAVPDWRALLKAALEEQARLRAELDAIRNPFHKNPDGSLTVDVGTTQVLCPHCQKAVAVPELDEAKQEIAWLAALLGKLVCAYCGHEEQRPASWDETKELMAKHLVSCDKHPMTAMQKQITALREALVEAEHELRWTSGTSGLPLGIVGRLRDAAGRAAQALKEGE